MAEPPKQRYFAGLKPQANSVPKLTRTVSRQPGSLLVVQFCCQCKNLDCRKVFPLETGVRSIESDHAEALLAKFAIGFEFRTADCPACGHSDWYFPQDVGFDVLEG
jgi:hypothetical protein